MTPPTTLPPPRLVTTLLAVALASHIAAAIGWWWFMPGGFPLTSPRWWINDIAPLAVGLVALTARIQLARQRPGARPLLLAIAAAWLGLALGLRTIFPITFRWLWLLPCGVGLVLTILTLRVTRQGANSVTRLAVLLGFCLGVFAAWTQRALPAATAPANVAFAPTTIMTTTARALTLAPQVHVDAQQGTVTFGTAMRELIVEPLLTFTSRSPDGCWTLFAPGLARTGPPRRLCGLDVTTAGAEALYQSDHAQSLTVRVPDPTSIRIASLTRLEQPIASHLNTFTRLQWSGGLHPQITFSPCPGTPIDIPARDRPRRHAYLGADGTFRVVVASHVEKGPFRTLAEGHLDRGAPLIITLHDGDTAHYAITLHDWSAQLSTQLSPTAGFGLPENAIEFTTSDDRTSARVFVFLPLASTSVGRGFDCVTHAPGVYQNRVHVQDLAPAPK